MVKNNIDPKSSMTGSDPVQDAIKEAYQRVLQVLESRTQQGQTRRFKWDAIYNDAVYEITDTDINPNDMRIKDFVLQRLIDNNVVQNGKQAVDEIVFTHKE
jgi:thioesterase domain-containing protein